MPYQSQAQQRFFHTDTAREHGITPDMVHEWDQASKGMKLPKRSKKERQKAVIQNAILGRK